MGHRIALIGCAPKSVWMCSASTDSGADKNVRCLESRSAESGECEKTLACTGWRWGGPSCPPMPRTGGNSLGDSRRSADTGVVARGSWGCAAVGRDNRRRCLSRRTKVVGMGSLRIRRQGSATGDRWTGLVGVGAVVVCSRRRSSAGPGIETAMHTSRMA